MVLWLIEYRSLQWSTNILFSPTKPTVKHRIFPQYLIGIWQCWTDEQSQKELVSHGEVLSDSQRHHRTRELRLISSQGLLAKWCQVSPATSDITDTELSHLWVCPMTLWCRDRGRKWICHEDGHSTENSRPKASWKIFQSKYWGETTLSFLFFKITSLPFFCWHLVKWKTHWW